MHLTVSFLHVLLTLLNCWSFHAYIPPSIPDIFLQSFFFFFSLFLSILLNYLPFQACIHLYFLFFFSFLSISPSCMSLQAIAPLIIPTGPSPSNVCMNLYMASVPSGPSSGSLSSIRHLPLPSSAAIATELIFALRVLTRMVVGS